MFCHNISTRCRSIRILFAFLERLVICAQLSTKIYRKSPYPCTEDMLPIFAVAAGSIHADGSSGTAHALYGSQADQ